VNRVRTCSAACILLLAVAIAAAADEPATFLGEISDSQCALNVHSLTKSHGEMLKSRSGAAGKTAATCSIYCVTNLGGRYVLASKAHVYHLDNQELPKNFVGQKVRLKGILDPKTNIIYVIGIEAR